MFLVLLLECTRCSLKPCLFLSLSTWNRVLQCLEETYLREIHAVYRWPGQKLRAFLDFTRIQISRIINLREREISMRLIHTRAPESSNKSFPGYTERAARVHARKLFARVSKLIVDAEKVNVSCRSLEFRAWKIVPVAFAVASPFSRNTPPRCRVERTAGAPHLTSPRRAAPPASVNITVFAFTSPALHCKSKCKRHRKIMESYEA